MIVVQSNNLLLEMNSTSATELDELRNDIQTEAKGMGYIVASWDPLKVADKVGFDVSDSEAENVILECLERLKANGKWQLKLLQT